ncbi:hypothetical protein BDV93DRAFT_510526 [Ceratobasidium sp. AG-I]|nr:hypothetical protein BDV93DRAFT_510526 [Ceratobasidium sp. AG-I]
MAISVKSKPPRQPPRYAHCYQSSVRAKPKTDTPCRPASAQRVTTGSQIKGSRTTASHSRSHVSYVVNSKSTKQPEIEKRISTEMEDAIFLDNDFVQNFLTGDSGYLDQVLERCKTSTRYSKRAKSWSLPKKGAESKLYRPILEIVNAIKRAVEACGDAETDTISPLFIDHSAHTIPADDADSANTKPDIVLFEDRHEHWETVRIAIEVKLKPNQLKERIQQLSRYARAMYAHQLHRRHLYGLVVCGSKATFVRYDRAGIIHSPPIDICKSYEAFTKAFASLLMLDRTAEGYDPAFSTTTNEPGRLDYYVDLPESAFGNVPVEPNVAGPPRSGASEDGAGPGPEILPTRRFKVIERLCHRKSIRGRATIVLRIREVVGSDEEMDKGKGKGKEPAEGSKKKRKADEMEEAKRLDYVFKLIWRDPLRGSEGDVLKMLLGMFGLAQYVWHCDVIGECRCGASGTCGTCVGKTPQPADLRPSPVFKSSGAASVDGREAASTFTDARNSGATGCVRKHRIYSRILMSSVGEPLWAADSVEEFLQSVLDAILGYWRLVNLGILHRDVSDGNVMMLRGDQMHARLASDEERSMDIEELRKRFGAMAESEAMLRQYLDKLERPSSGMLSDFDLHTTHWDGVVSAHGLNDGADFNSSSSAPISDAPSKRRKTDTGGSLSITATSETKGKGKARQSIVSEVHNSRRTPEFDEGRPLVDYRTGTPTFMSVRVLTTKPGMRCDHNFMDDLESFFWLILWSVAAHLDPKQDPTVTVQETIDLLEQADLVQMLVNKKSLLSECIEGGEDIKNRLLEFKNQWATNSKISSLIHSMGQFFIRARYREHSPTDAFPTVVDMIYAALHPSNHAIPHCSGFRFYLCI